MKTYPANLQNLFDWRGKWFAWPYNWRKGRTEWMIRVESNPNRGIVRVGDVCRVYKGNKTYEDVVLTQHVFSDRDDEIWEFSSKYDTVLEAKEKLEAIFASHRMGKTIKDTLDKFRLEKKKEKRMDTTKPDPVYVVIAKYEYADGHKSIRTFNHDTKGNVLSCKNDAIRLAKEVVAETGNAAVTAHVAISNVIYFADNRRPNHQEWFHNE